MNNNSQGCKLTKGCHEYRRADLVSLAVSCGIQINRVAPLKGQKNMDELCTELTNLTTQSDRQERARLLEEQQKELEKREQERQDLEKKEKQQKQSNRCQLTKKCRDYKRNELVELAKSCGIEIARSHPLKGPKNMDELCTELTSTYDKFSISNINMEKPSAMQALFNIAPIKFPDNVKDYLARADELFKKYGYIPDKYGWYFFRHNEDPQAYQLNEKATNQWKVFYNPKKEFFFPVLETILSTLQEDKVMGKIPLDPFHTRKHGGPMIDSPIEPKIVMYYVADNSADAKKKLHDQTIKVFNNIPKKYIGDISMGCAFITIDKDNVKQCGPSFTKSINPLAYYTQGGYTESTRGSIISEARWKGVPAKQLLEEEYDGEQFHKYLGESEPFTPAEFDSLA